MQQRLVSLVGWVMCAVTLAGCDQGQSLESAADRAYESGQYEAAAQGYQSAAARARRDRLDGSMVSRLEAKAADARQQSARANADGARRLLVEARSDAQAGRWGSMLDKVDRSKMMAEQANDSELASQVGAVCESRLILVARTARAYQAMARAAGWATFESFLCDDDWLSAVFEQRAERMGFDLEDAATNTGDRELAREAIQVSRAFREYNNAKERSRARVREQQGDDSLLGLLGDILTDVDEVSRGISYDQVRRTFERRLTAALTSCGFPDLELQSPRSTGATVVASPPSSPTGLREGRAGSPAATRAPESSGVAASVSALADVAEGGRTGTDLVDGDEDQLRRTGY